MRVKLCIFLPENANLHPDSHKPGLTNPRSGHLLGIANFSLRGYVNLPHNHLCLQREFHATSLRETFLLHSTEFAKKVCPRLRELTPVARGGITQPRTDFYGHRCTATFLQCRKTRLTSSGMGKFLLKRN